MTCEGKIFREYGKHSILISDLNMAKLEQVVDALRGIVQLNRAGYTG